MATKKVGSKATAPKPYKGHKPGSRKAKVHEAFDKHGTDVAFTLGRKLQLADGTLRTWFGTWERDN